MCRFLQVQEHYTLCGHSYRRPDQELRCNDRFCKFSSAHPKDCGPNCSTTCWQYRQFPEQYHRTTHAQCPICDPSSTSR
ncbi:hypothetical protein JOM56_003559 [Amanita muscaria]